MSDTKKISPAKEKSKKVVEETSSKPSTQTNTGVSPFGVVFLSLLTLAAVLSGTFAFRDKVLPYVQQYLVIPAVETVAITPPPGFVPIPAMAETPSLELASSVELEAIKVTQTELAAQIMTLKNTAPQTIVSTDNSELQTQLTSTETKLAESLARISALEAKLQETQSLTTALANKPDVPAAAVDIRGLVAFQNLQSKALAGQPFQVPLQRVIALLDDSSSIENAISKLEQIAPTGRISLNKLQTEFKLALSKHMQAGTAPEDGSFMGKVQQNLSSFVRVRRTDGTGDEEDTAISAAEAALSKGDIQTAYSELLKVDSDAFKTWLPLARHYYQLPEWLDAIQLQLANSLEAIS